MTCEDSQSSIVVLHLTESVFVDDLVVVCVLKNARCNPRLQNEPAASSMKHEKYSQRAKVERTD